MNGIVADNVANDGGDMVFDVTAAVGTVQLPNMKIANAYSIHPEAVLEAKQTMGDAASALTMIMMHSRVFTNLQAQNMIAYVPTANSAIQIPTYLGYRVLVSDTMPVTGSAGNYTYYTYLCAPGILGWAEKPPAVPVATTREETQGNGAGVEILVTRRQFALHPYGFSWTDSSVAAEFPTIAELETASNWDRKYPERKQIKFAVLKTKNG